LDDMQRSPVRSESATVRAPREAWVDNLRVAAIAAVIVVHTATAYIADFADWYYDDELEATTAVSVAVALPALLGGIFGLGPLSSSRAGSRPPRWNTGGPAGSPRRGCSVWGCRCWPTCWW
jgi:hypothetical protein